MAVEGEEPPPPDPAAGSAGGRGLHSFHFSANVSAFCGIGGAFRVRSGGVQDYEGVFRVYFVSETAQVELKSGRV